MASAINKAEQVLDNGLVNEIADQRRQLLESKTHPQPVGGDVLKVVSSQTVSTTFTLGANVSQVGGFAWSLPKAFLTLYTPLFSVYVDGTLTADAYPFGANITGDKFNCQLLFLHDYALSNDTTGFRQYVWQLWNQGTSSHTYTIKHRLNFPILPLT